MLRAASGYAVRAIDATDIKGLGSGDNVKITEELIEDSPIAMDEGLRFAIREGGRTVGAGRVTKILK